MATAVGNGAYDAWGYSQVMCYALDTGAYVACTSIDEYVGVAAATSGAPYVAKVRKACGGGFLPCPVGRFSSAGPHIVSNQCLDLWGDTFTPTVTWGGFRASNYNLSSLHYRVCPYPNA